MIKFSVGIALIIKDSFTMRPVGGKGLLFFVDGLEVRPVAKPGGFFAFTGIPQGTHELRVKSAQFLEECLTIEAGTELHELWLTPSSSYPFGIYPKRTLISYSKEPKGPVYVGRKTPAVEMKLMEADPEKDAFGMKLYFDDAIKAVPLPGSFLIEDEAAPEVVRIDELTKDGPSTLGTALTKAHKRGLFVSPAVSLRVREENGRYISEVFTTNDSELCIYVPESGMLVKGSTSMKEITV